MAADTIRFIVTVAIVVYKGLIPVVGRMLTSFQIYTYIFIGIFNTANVNVSKLK